MMSANIESDESDFDIMDVVSCVAVSDEKGKSRSYLLQKEKILGSDVTKGGLLRGSHGNSYTLFLIIMLENR